MKSREDPLRVRCIGDSGIRMVDRCISCTRGPVGYPFCPFRSALRGISNETEGKTIYKLLTQNL